LNGLYVAISSTSLTVLSDFPDCTLLESFFVFTFVDGGTVLDFDATEEVYEFFEGSLADLGGLDDTVGVDVSLDTS
jgi:hypothetical protein